MQQMVDKHQSEMTRRIGVSAVFVGGTVCQSWPGQPCWPAPCSASFFRVVDVSLLKVGMTVSASSRSRCCRFVVSRLLGMSQLSFVPAFLRMRRATILENNMVKRAQPASLAWSRRGDARPDASALEMDLFRTMTVAVLNGLWAFDDDSAAAGIHHQTAQRARLSRRDGLCRRTKGW
jgi:hypothetical protein